VKQTKGDKMTQYLNEHQVAEIVNMSVQTLRNDRAGERKLFPYYKIGRSVRYRLDEVLSAMESRKIETQPLTPGNPLNSEGNR
jgi:hypothetical protein